MIGILFNMGKDKRGVDRGPCSICPCDEYETEGSILCEYCGHTPIQHPTKDNIQTDEPSKKKTKVCDDQSDEVIIEIAETSCLEQTEQESNLPGVDNKEPIPSQSKEEDTGSAQNNPERRRFDHDLSKLQMIANNLMSKTDNGSTHIELKRSNSKIFANCNVCTQDIQIQRVSQGAFLLEQHLDTQMHKTNAEITRYREEGTLLEASKLRNKIMEKFPNSFIFKNEKLCCRSCAFEITLSGRKNIIGNLSQHLSEQQVNSIAKKTIRNLALSCLRTSLHFLVRRRRALTDHQKLRESSFVKDFTWTNMFIV